MYLWPSGEVKNFYHVLRVSEKLLARHLAEIVHLQSTRLFHNIIISVVGPEIDRKKKKPWLTLQMFSTESVNQ